MVRINQGMNVQSLQLYRRQNSRKLYFFDFWLFCLGSLINTVSFLSPAPVLLALLILGFFYVVLSFTPVGGLWESRIFYRVFFVGFFMSGVAAVYANQFFDQSQLHSDSSSFYELASASSFRYLPLIQLQVLHEGALVIKIWSFAYDFFSSLGFPRERYIGTLINSSAVALTGVFTLKMARFLYGHDVSRFKRLILFFSLCGLFWLVAGIHLRDSFLLLSSTTLSFIWLYFLQKPDIKYRLIVVIVSSLLAVSTFGLLRREFIGVPIVTALASTAALMFGVKSKQRLTSYFLVFIGVSVSVCLFLGFGNTLHSFLKGGGEGYLALAEYQHGTDSLGLTLIVNQPLPIRMLLGSIYLFVFPIPFWGGFQIASAYHLFKSLNAVFCYFLLPLLALSAYQIWIDRVKRSYSMLYLLFVSIVFTVLIAITSLETRHLAAFLPLIFLLALLPDISVKSVRLKYNQLLICVLAFIALVHLVWFLVKI